MEEVRGWQAGAHVREGVQGRGTARVNEVKHGWSAFKAHEAAGRQRRA